MIVCGQCSHKNESFFKFCLRCGSEIASPAPSIAAAPPAPASLELVRQRAEDAQLRDTVSVPAVVALDAMETKPELIAVTPHAAEEPGSPEDVPDEPELPGDEPVAPGDEPDGPSDAPELPSDEPERPGDEPRAPGDEPELPDEAPEGPDDEPEPPDDEPELPDDAPGLPDDEPSLPEDEPELPDGEPERTDEHGGTYGQAQPAAEIAAPAFTAAPPEPLVSQPMPRAEEEEGPTALGTIPRAAPARVAAVSDRSVVAELVLIGEDGSDGRRFSVFDGITSIGRTGTDIAVPDDAYLSAVHAEVLAASGEMIVRDTGTINGTFLRITEPVAVEHGDTFRIGQELLRFEAIDQLPIEVASSGNDGVEVIGAPLPEDAWGRLVQVVLPDVDGNAYLLRGRFVTLGRERGDIVFPEDGYVSGRHASLARRRDALYLEDLESSNGTYIRLKTDTAVYEGDLLLMGQQLFRVQL